MSDGWLQSIIPDVIFCQKRRQIPERATIEHTAVYNDLVLVTEGCVRYTIDGEAYDLSAGEMLFVALGRSKRSERLNDDPFSLFTCLFNYRLPDQTSPPLPWPTILRPEDYSEIVSAFTQLSEIWASRASGRRLMARGSLMVILGMIISQLSSQPGDPAGDFRQIRKIQQYVVRHYAEKINSQTLRQLTGLHPAYLSNLFHKQTGSTISSFIRTIRIRKAAELLASGDYNVSEAAALCGFDDPLYFSKVFRKVMGLPPSHYAGQALSAQIKDPATSAGRIFH